MDYLKQLLPKYKIKACEGFNIDIEIFYDKLNHTNYYTKNGMIECIDRFKFIHDNIDYIIEMLLANGFLQNENTHNMYIKNNLTIRISYGIIELFKYAFPYKVGFIDYPLGGHLPAAKIIMSNRPSDRRILLPTRDAQFLSTMQTESINRIVSTERLCNIETMLDDLRIFIDADISYKPVIKNE